MKANVTSGVRKVNLQTVDEDAADVDHRQLVQQLKAKDNPKRKAFVSHCCDFQLLLWSCAVSSSVVMKLEVKISFWCASDHMHSGCREVDKD